MRINIKLKIDRFKFTSFSEGIKELMNGIQKT